MGAEMYDRYYAAQLVRDEFMAARVAQAAASPDVDVCVVLAGRGHIDYGLGVPRRAQTALREPALVILPAGGASELEESRVEGLPEALLLADLLWIVGGVTP